MKAPRFWEFGQRSLCGTLLSPFGFLYNLATHARAHQAPQWSAPIPVICIGNLTMGGAGKTPTALAVVQYLIAQGCTPFFLSRGYGGQLSGPVMVTDQTSHEVGDEPLLLAQYAPVCVSHDRVAGAKLCVAQGANVIVMDDGYQNPHLKKDLSLIVLDGGYGHGNEKVFPAGPLRETLESGLARADAVVLIGDDATGALDRISSVRKGLPILKASIHVQERSDIQDDTFVAFAGIARPQKFFDTLAALGGKMVATKSYPDHYTYRSTDIEELQTLAKAHQARLITTEKDVVRLPASVRANVDTLKITLVFEGEDVLKPVLFPVLKK